MSLVKIAVLGSTRGSNLFPFQQKLQERSIPASITVVLSNKSDAPILTKAQELGLPAMALASNGLARQEYDAILAANLKRLEIDVVVLMGFMRILSPEMIEPWASRIINVHPSLLPLFPGLMDKAVHQAVLDANRLESGCTVHEVSAEVDQGPILVQKKCPVYRDDTVDSLKVRVQALEADALVDAIAAMIGSTPCWV